MIDGIRKRIGRSIARDPWDADQVLNPEIAETELPTDRAVLVAATDATHSTGEYIPANSNTPDYYKILLLAAIENGGKYGDLKIAVPWLRMILAGLEFKHIEPEMMWFGADAGGLNDSPLRDLPAYEDLFPSDSDIALQPRAS
jgi:hypothetical protein